MNFRGGSSRSCRDHSDQIWLRYAGFPYPLVSIDRFAANSAFTSSKYTEINGSAVGVHPSTLGWTPFSPRGGQGIPISAMQCLYGGGDFISFVELPSSSKFEELSQKISQLDVNNIIKS
ncbi:hypothetical protein [Paenibacillus marchantiophytorum]|uniref:hypothetical protein n=1 Tax=Paenibacillus marchantiophytorum TaxID=1619310 RepID=UPI00166D9E9D|nr:hypothetical protein [Paenibacillus marchantiophytorum]